MIESLPTQDIELVISDPGEVESVHGQVQTFSPGDGEVASDEGSHGLDESHGANEAHAEQHVTLEAMPITIAEDWGELRDKNKVHHFGHRFFLLNYLCRRFPRSIPLCRPRFARPRRRR